MKSNSQERFRVLKNGRIVTMNPWNEIREADLLVDGDRIQAIGRFDTSLGNTVDLNGRLVIPGFVQTHVHLCQTLFRGMADDLELLDWLKKKIWPLEAAHNEASLRVSAQLGGMELIAGGTTTVLTMETVRHTDVVLAAVERLGLRAIIGKCMMDEGDRVPAPMREKTAQSIKECQRLHKEWDGRDNGRIRFALAPRFALACSEALFRQLGEFAASHQVPIHSHASENLKEVQAVWMKTGRKNVAYFRDLNLPGHLLFLAHCIWIDAEEMEILKEQGIRVLHCPSSNLKLGSGIAMVPELLRNGVSVSLGADGAPCNNNLDMFAEMRLAAQLQQFRLGPTAMPARDVLRMATIDGARALGMEADIGSIEPGKKADLVILDEAPLHTLPSPDPVSAVVYAYRAGDVDAVMVDGKFLYRNHSFVAHDPAEVRAGVLEELPRLCKRAEKYGF
jgi:5-methylthioadenosine/S-adenosylhomocysteine deaminase